MNYRLSTKEEIDLIASYIAKEYNQTTKDLPNKNIPFMKKDGIERALKNLENDTIDMFLEYKNYFYSTLETGFGYKLVVLLCFDGNQDGETCEFFTSTYAVFPGDKVCEISNLNCINKNQDFDSLNKDVEDWKHFDTLPYEEQQKILRDKFNEETQDDE